MKQKVIKIFQKHLQLVRQEEHGYRINWKKSLWPFLRGGSQLYTHIYHAIRESSSKRYDILLFYFRPVLVASHWCHPKCCRSIKYLIQADS